MTTPSAHPARTQPRGRPRLALLPPATPAAVPAPPVPDRRPADPRGRTRPAASPRLGGRGPRRRGAGPAGRPPRVVRFPTRRRPAQTGAPGATPLTAPNLQQLTVDLSK